MDYRDVNKLFYDKNAEKFDAETKKIRPYVLRDAELFITYLPGIKILDLGSGSGRDSIFFKERGLKPICLDISQEMIKLCRQQDLEAVVSDLEDIPFQDESFDGVWAHTSLLHMPKSKLSSVLIKIKQILTPKGVFYISMKEGNFEGWLESDKYKGDKRFFSLYSDEELKKAISPHFDINNISRVSLGEAVFLNYMCKRPS